MPVDASLTLSGSLRRSGSHTRRSLLARLARPAGDAPLEVFCSGIGGTGLSGLARLAAALGHHVRGSDQARSPLAEALEASGLEVAYGQRAENVPDDADLFIATAALPAEHPELARALERGLPVVKYAEALGAFVAARRGVAIAGTHGKTTTAALTAFVLQACGRDPSFIVGGAPKDLGQNSRLGEGPELVLEACEYDRSFRHYRPTCAVILNIEADHLDCYKGGIDEIVGAFVEFANGLQDGGALVVSADWPHALRVADALRTTRPDVQRWTFGLADGARITARRLRYEDGLGRFDLVVDGRVVAPVRLSIPGEHNVANALAALAAAVVAGAAPEVAAAALEGFSGVRRRFDVLGEPDGVTVVDDYAHHPTAVRAVVEAARARYPGRRIVALFEPHQASRTREHFDEFADALALADRVVVGEIYACRDTAEDVRAVTAADLARAVRGRAPGTQATCTGGPDEVIGTAVRLLQQGDVALFMGAGRISGAAHRAIERLARRRSEPLPPLARIASGRFRRGGDGLEAAVTAELGALVRTGEPLGPRCTIKAGGVARFFAEPRTEAEAVRVVRALRARGVPIVPLGGGSNLLFTSPLVDAAVISARGLRGAQVLGTRVRASAGEALPGLIRLAERHGLGGLELFAGIPGTIGGAVAGNAGGPAGAGAIGDRLVRVRLLDAHGTVRWVLREQLSLGYRTADLEGGYVLAVELELAPRAPDYLRARRQEALKKKAAGQPLEARSPGCFWKNPPGDSAGRLIDAAGLKGLSRGGARVSPVHANFIINDGDATVDDVLELACEVRRRVREARGVVLEAEVRLVA
jgi:UDP-N-acetylmuramate--L-alanine ligase/UDP-N-acetylenolpyruvoylglucosamine reductase